MDALVTKIVVPIDFSPSSERAANYAAALARRVGASLHLIHALEPSALMRGASGAYEIQSAEHLDDPEGPEGEALGTLESLGAARFQAFVARADRVEDGRWELTIDPL